MCGGARYTDQSGKVWTIYFPRPKAALPVLKKDGGIDWVTWGRRREEEAPFFVPGGWARLDSIQAGKWARFAPRPVLLPLRSFMEKDRQRRSHWIEVPPGEAIQGLLATYGSEARVYVVTTDTPAEYHWIHDRWPRLVERSMAA